MKKNKNAKPIYGDNDQLIYEELIKNEKEINEMVEIATDRALKKRSTMYKKNKRAKDDTVNSGKKGEPLKDMDVETFDLSVDTDLLPNTLADSSQKKEKKKGKRKLIMTILILIFLSAGAYFGYPYAKPYIEGIMANMNTGNQPSVTEDLLPTALPTIEPTTTPLATVEVEQPIEGRLNSKEDKEYTVEETLGLADTFNTNLITYFNEYTDSVTTGSFESAVVKAGTYEKMASADRNILMEYTDVFAAVNGGDFLNTVIERYDNAVNMFAALTLSVDKPNMMATMNIYIQQENYLSSDSKASLIDFLNANGIEFIDNDDYITFSLFDTDVEIALGGGEEEVVATETPTETTTTVEGATPVASETPATTQAPSDNKTLPTIDPDA